MIYFIADTHFNHTNILKLANRPFSSVEEMNQTLIENWNRKIKGNDTVYILGDMFFKSKDTESITQILSQLNGRKYLLGGNHDSWLSNVDVSKFFISVNGLLETSIGDVGASLCHYPLVSWKHEKKTYMIHGHIHTDTSSEYWPILCSNPRILNAGVDINNFEPVTLEELIENNNHFKEEYLKNQEL